MKIGILHFSDFHVKENEHFLNEKIQKIQSALNVLGRLDEYIIVFSGDLSNSGKANEFKRARFFFNKIIPLLKEKNSGKFVPLCIVPGNHDLLLPENCRDCKIIQAAYDSNKIEELIDDELSYLNNFYEYSNGKANTSYNKFVNRQVFTFGEYKVQFNLINTAPFSTLSPDDKELHYFPNDKMYMLKKGNDINLCITVMHHNWESFNWKCKFDLEKTIIDNSEFVLCGHDHIDKGMTISIDNSMDTWVSVAGAMELSKIEYEDSFNVIVVDTDQNNFSGFAFSWDNKTKI